MRLPALGAKGKKGIPGTILLGPLIGAVLVLSWVGTAAAAAPGPPVKAAALQLSGDFAADSSGAPEAENASELRGFLPDMVRLYAEPWDIGARETGVWLGAVALLVRYDQPIYDWLGPRLDEPWVKDADKILGSYALPLAAIGLAWAEDPRLGLACGEAVTFALFNVQVLKCVLGMARPYLGEGPVFHGPSLDDDYWAMPSAHTATAFALATILANEYPRWKWLHYTCAVLVGLSRISSGDHWASNVLAGSLLGIHAAQRVLGREFTVFKWEF